MKKNKFVFITIILFILLIPGITLQSCGSGETPDEDIYFVVNNEGRITVKQPYQPLEGKKRIWINGVNTPWDRWNDFGGAYNSTWWDAEFGRLREAGINATRVWINCNNDQGAVIIGDDGMVSGVNPLHWTHLDSFFELAKKNKIYIMATILSFDHFITQNQRNGVWSPRDNGEKWQKVLKNKTASQSFVDYYTIPLVERYGSNPYLWSIDLCNEPDWVHEDQRCYSKETKTGVPWENMSYFFALNAAAIHENSDVLVTTGLAYTKWNKDSSYGGNGNMVSDTRLQNLYPNPNAYMDFWSTHYYDWVGEWYGVPFYLSPYGSLLGNNRGWSGGWGLDPSKPAVIGECSAGGTGLNKWGLADNNIITDYEEALKNGWQGVMAWTSNAVDSNGGLYPVNNRPDTQLKEATLNIYTKYPDLVYPYFASKEPDPEEPEPDEPEEPNEN